jgi:hypothetical protein
MAVAQGYGKTVTSGSVFAYDVADTKNSYKGKPTTNFFTNGHFSNGAGITQEAGSNATNEIIYFPNNPGATNYVLKQSQGQITEYQINLTNQLQSNTTYVMSGWYAESLDYAGESRMFHSVALSTSGAHVALGTGIGTVLKTVEINGIIWKYCYATITTPSDYSNTFSWYLGYGGGAYTGARYYTNIMMEQGTVPSQFVNGTRSATQGLLPLIGNTSLDLSTVSFDSNAQMTFDGTDDRIQTSYAPTFGDFTVCLIFKDNGSGAWGRIVDKLYTTGFFISSYFASSGANYVGAGVIEPNYPHGIALPYEAGKYHYFASVRNGTTHTIYLDGITQTTSKTVTSNLLDSTSIAFGDWSGSNTQPFKGELPIVRIYNRALSAAEVKQNYLQYKTRFNLS